MSKNKTQSAKPAIPVVKPPPVAPLFRPIDWFTLVITTLVVFTGYFLTLAPNVTLEDSGELATGSFYAGVPHPPGYPVWTMFTWLFTKILPIGSVAWRVGVASAVAGALTCGLVAFLVSRGSSMIMEGIAGLKVIDRRWESAICIVSGFVAGCLEGFNGFMWSQADIVEVYCFSVLSFLVVMLCLMRWSYAPHQRYYLYLAFFFFGICFTNHQTLLLAAPGLEFLVLMVDYRLGRNMFLGNGLIYLGMLVANAKGMVAAFNGNPVLFTLINVVGVVSLYIFSWNSVKIKTSTRIFILLGHLLINAIIFVIWSNGGGQSAGAMTDASYSEFMALFNPVLIVLIYLFFLLTNMAENIIPFQWPAFRREVLPGFGTLFCWIFGAAFYLYMPITSMTNPPMNWGYPRTYEGFLHALFRGQYEKIMPSDVFHQPVHFLSQMQTMFGGVVEEFNWVYVFIALVPLLFFIRMQKRERAWLIGLGAVYFCLSIFLLVFLNPSADRASQDLTKVFFAAGHVVVAMFIGYGLALISASMATRYETFRGFGFLGAFAAIDFALFSLIIASQDLLSNSLDTNAITLNGLGKILCWLVIAACFTLSKKERFQPERPILFAVGVIAAIASLGLTLATLLNNTLSLAGLHDFTNTLAACFKPDQYALPVFAGLILLGMTLIFLAAIFMRRQRAPLALSLALFAAMPIHSVMCNWFENEERGHWFGYWFGHDMFSPPFDIYPEMTRNTILFGGTDPGRFVPTYMIFCESFVPPSCKPMDPKFDRRDVYIITQNALADGTYLDYIRAQYNRSTQQDPPFFKETLTNLLGIFLGQDNSFVRGISSLAYNMLDVPLTRFGANVEKRRRAEGVYPPKEIYTPSPEDSQNCFRDYMDDAARRKQANQLQPGESVNIDPDGKVQVSGQVSVMMINGLLCKVIFDHNPTNDFYVEESFPLQWMYPYETPAGIIMKINRHPLPELTDDIFKKDHEFWSKYSQRFIGNWITYDTSVKEIADFAEKVYLQHNFSGFKGDRKFIRDDDAQKAFSKLRSSIAGVYDWRLTQQCPPEYRQKTAAATQALIAETDFSFKQSFAFCPYSPEAVFRYINFLLQFNRIGDAQIVAQTCLKLDPYNEQVKGLVNQLEDFKKQSAQRGQIESQLQQMEAEARNNPTNFENIFKLAQLYFQMQQTDRVIALFDQAAANPNIPAGDLGVIAQFYAQTGNLPKLESTLAKIAKMVPNQPEPWYDLAALKAVIGKNNEALQDLQTSLDLSAARLKTNAAARDLLAEARKDQRFDSLHNLPDFQKLVPPK